MSSLNELIEGWRGNGYGKTYKLDLKDIRMIGNSVSSVILVKLALE